MSTFVAELAFPGAAELTGSEVDAIARRARRLAEELGSGVQWLGGYLTGGGFFAVYQADDEELVRVHLTRLGLDGGSVEQVTAVIAPTPTRSREDRR